jgi:hypothetical protein
MQWLLTPNQPHAIHIGQLLGNVCAQPVGPALTCHGLGPCAGSPVPSILTGDPDQVLMLHLVRNLQGAATKVLSPVARPQGNQRDWPGLEARVLLAHLANPQNWVAFVSVQGVWWRADSARLGRHPPGGSLPGPD